MAYKDRTRQRKYQREWLADRKDRYMTGRHCALCDRPHSREHPLTPHHRDPAQKEDHRIWSWSPERIEAELAKCTDLCDDCHKAYELGKMIFAKPMIHGTVQAYWRGCRCENCRAANAAYKRQRVQAQALPVAGD